MSDEMISVVVEEVHPIPAEAPPDPEWGEQFGQDSGFSFEVSRWTVAIFVDRRITRGTADERIEALSQGYGKPVAHLVDCVGLHWRLDSEMVSPTRAGTILYAASGKAMGSGQVDLEPERNEARFTVQTLYEGITNRDTVEGSLSGEFDGHMWSVRASVTVTSSR